MKKKLYFLQVFLYYIFDDYFYYLFLNHSFPFPFFSHHPKKKKRISNQRTSANSITTTTVPLCTLLPKGTSSPPSPSSPSRGTAAHTACGAPRRSPAASRCTKGGTAWGRTSSEQSRRNSRRSSSWNAQITSICFVGQLHLNVFSSFFLSFFLFCSLFLFLLFLLLLLFYF